MVVVAGQPGAPEDWITGGQLPTLLDTFAKAHNGLSKDVPNWIATR